MQNTEIITSNVNLKFDILLRRRNHFLSAIKNPFPNLTKTKEAQNVDISTNGPSSKWPLEVLPIPASQQERLTEVLFS